MENLKQNLEELKKKRLSLSKKIEAKKREYSNELFSQCNLFDDQRSDPEKLFEVKPSKQKAEEQIRQYKNEQRKVNAEIEKIKKCIHLIEQGQSKIL